MLDAIETARAAVNEAYIIRWLNMSMPFSIINGNVRYDKPLIPDRFKGMYITARPRSKGEEEEKKEECAENKDRYWFRIRGSLIKVAYDGLHNHYAIDPFQMLYALDDMLISLGIDPFKTPLNGLELSATIPCTNPERIVHSMASYANRRPNFQTIDRDGISLPYAEVKLEEFKLKLYAPTPTSLRIELKIDKMRSLGPNRPMTFADLARPACMIPLALKIVNAFEKIMWKCPDIDLAKLTQAERDLYLRGKEHDYWQIRRGDYTADDAVGFKRVEKQRSREKERYQELIQRHWPGEPLADLTERFHHHQQRYIELISTPLYQALLNFCQERWEYVANSLGSIRLPNRLKLSPLSEISPLYLGRFPTTHNDSYFYPAKPVVSATQLNLFSEKDTFQNLIASFTASPNKSHLKPIGKALSSSLNRALGSERRRFKTALNASGGLHFTIPEVESMLSLKTKIALSCREQPLEELIHSRNNPAIIPKPTPLF